MTQADRHTSKMKTALLVLAFAALAYAERSEGDSGLVDLVIGGDQLVEGRLFENLIDLDVNRPSPVLVARRQKRSPLLGGLIGGLFGRPTPKPKPQPKPVPSQDLENEAETATDDALILEESSEEDRKGINIGLGPISIGIGK
ncbi:uncharacterized protein LOC113497183 [Trichoplusia ni]|uniref:Uncharacterized protein LOC113497183 n=1 Tax=Trichoplusia ni TaxID=7111 RepID=A0A7E5VVN3_TRINI|nr:uncharacterized protein LOC113497183 [Trichoplusia ni]